MKHAIIPFVLVLLSACAPHVISDPEPAAVVQDYYAALNARDYAAMYALISPGFKLLEPTAGNVESFSAAMAAFFDTAQSIEVARADVRSNDGKTAVVDYVAISTMNDGSTRELKSAFTLRKKEDGWKLIHPYGEHKDLS